MFVGVHERQLDERGRVALPAPFRSTIGEHCYLTYGEDGCVRVMGDEAFRAEVEELVEAVKRGEMTRSRQRAIASSVVQAQVDKQGRITLDQRLRDHADLEVQGPVMVLGVFDRIEIWEPGRYRSEEAAGQHEIAGDAGEEAR